MKLQAETVAVESEGFSAKKFSVDVNDPAIIQIITQQIYNDPYVWPRELLANARDAGGIFEIVIPDALELNWSVEDHGEGMSDEFMAGRYTSIFDSTKRDDNTKTGGFGHGRLSPLAYTDSFEVRSRYMHESKIMEGNYVVFRGENKIPEISRVSLGLSDVQQTGVKVTVPVSVKDITKITSRTQYYASYSSPTPEGIKPITYLFADSTGGVRSYMSSNVDEFSGIRLIMGGVPYPAPNLNAGSYQYNSNNLELDLFFEVGELSPTLARDAINGNEDAKNLIRKRLNKLQTAVSTYIDKEISSKTTLLEQYVEYQRFSNSMDYSTRTYLMKGITPPSSIRSTDIMSVAKKDFAVHFVVSDIQHHAWDGMDEESKAFKSLSRFNIAMLTGRGRIQRREAVDTIDDEKLSFTEFVNQSGKLNAQFFAAPLPYARGQIKKLKQAMAKVIATKRLGQSEMKVVLIQYEDKADVQAITDLISKDITINWIDTGVVSGSLVKYVSVYIAQPGGKISSRSMTAAALAAIPNLHYMERDSMTTYHMYDKMSQIRLASKQLGLEDHTFVIINKGQEKHLPIGTTTIKDALIGAIPTYYPYPLDDKALEDLTRANANTSNGIGFKWLGTSVWGQNNLKLSIGEALLARPEIQAMPDVVTYLNLGVSLTKKGLTMRSTYQEIREKLSLVMGLINVKLIDKSDLPASTTPFPPKADAQDALVEEFNNRYLLLNNLYNSYMYSGRSSHPDSLLDHVVNYIVKCA